MELSSVQAEIIKSKAQYKLINGCAGSRKTDTLIKCAIRDLKKNKRPILFLTLVGSVTSEIRKRLEDQLGIKLYKERASNHYCGEYDSIPVCVSNYDAWVHLMLSDLADTHDIGGEYTLKVSRLLKRTKDESPTVIMKGGSEVGLLLIDEIQDFPPEKMEIVVNLAKKNSRLCLYVVGDYFQSLYEESIGKNHPMTYIKSELKTQCFELDTCYRCPLAHIEFNNLITGAMKRKCGIGLMRSSNNNSIDKPFIFTHKPKSGNASPRINAERITAMVSVLMDSDNSIVPSDIVFIMSKTNGETMFEQLKCSLKSMYAMRGFKNAIVHFSTKGDGYHKPIDWTKADGKTVLLSIHSDKGKGHKVVFLLV